MKSFKKLLLIIVIILVIVISLTACGTRHTCTDCGRQFRGNAYQGVFTHTVLCRTCAEEYWYPMDIRNFRIS